jgi:hypothetical protein
VNGNPYRRKWRFYCEYCLNVVNEGKRVNLGALSGDVFFRKQSYRSRGSSHVEGKASGLKRRLTDRVKGEGPRPRRMLPEWGLNLGRRERRRGYLPAPCLRP